VPAAVREGLHADRFDVSEFVPRRQPWEFSFRRSFSFVKGAYAAAIGTILGACALLARIAIGDWLTILIALGALIALLRWKVSNPLLMAVTAAAGLIAFPLLHPAWVMVK
jgi:hypothetical protein